MPDPRVHACVKPFHDTSLINEGGPHGEIDAARDIDGGAMDGFVASAIHGNHTYCAANPFSPDCTADTGRLGQPDAMGWHDEREIPNYWAYADRYVLQDHMFESVRSWSLPSHLAMVSGWSATCDAERPMSCTTDLGKYPLRSGRTHLRLDAVRVDRHHYLLHQAGVSWKYYVAEERSPTARTMPCSVRRRRRRSAPPRSGTRSRGSRTSTRTARSATYRR